MTLLCCIHLTYIERLQLFAAQEDVLSSHGCLVVTANIIIDRKACTLNAASLAILPETAFATSFSVVAHKTTSSIEV